MAVLSTLMSFGGEASAPESRSQQIMMTIRWLFAGLALAALWGLAAGSTSAPLALSSAYKVPMVIFLSALTALPAGLVTLRMLDAPMRAHQLVSAFASSIFGGTLILATLAPLVAIYYHTSSRVGVPLALGSVFVAIGVATVLFGRAMVRRLAGLEQRARSLIAVVVLVVLFLAALLQFVGLASPIIATVTRFDGGFDTVFR